MISWRSSCRLLPLLVHVVKGFSLFVEGVADGFVRRGLAWYHRREEVYILDYRVQDVFQFEQGDGDDVDVEKIVGFVARRYTKTGSLDHLSCSERG